MNNVLLFGNPNVGKTSIFNGLTESNEKVSNFEGATIQQKSALIKGTDYNMIDIPGTNSLGGGALVEKIAFDALLNDDYDFLVDVIDITNFKRNLYLLIDLLETGQKLNVVINMMDIYNGTFNKSLFEDTFGINVIVSQREKSNLNFEEISNLKNNAFHLDYGKEVEEALEKVGNILEDNKNNVDKRFVAIQALRNNEGIDKYVTNHEQLSKIKNDLTEQLKELGLAKSISGYMFKVRKQFIDKNINEIYSKGEDANELKWMNHNFDKIALHKVWGYVLFAVIMYLVFVITYKGGILQDIVDSWVGMFSDFTSITLVNYGVNAHLISFIVDGVIGGVGGVLVFLPQIIIMFAVLTFLEAVGYFSRITVLFERIFDKLGLSSHSMIPYISGLGCNVIGIMSTRTIKDEKKRIATILTAPFISCSARLPVYIIFIDLFFKDHKSLVLFGLYFLGIFVAILVAYILDHFVYKSEKEMLVYTLPKYKKVDAKYMARAIINKVQGYLVRAGKFIFLGSVIVWIVTNMGFSGYTEDIDNSFLGIIASKLSFVFGPLGFGSTEATASLMSAFLAKELAVSTMAVTYKAGAISNLGPILLTHFDSASAMAFMVYTLLYIPCISTLGAIYAELGKAKYVVYAVCGSLTIGYTLAFITKIVMDLFI